MGYDKNVTKSYTESLKIGDLAAMFGTTVRTIRYYEELGLLRSDDRSEGLHRHYPLVNIIYLKRIRQLKTYGLSLGEIKEFFDLAEQDPTGEKCRALLIQKNREKIEAQRAVLLEAQARIDALQAETETLETTSQFFSCPGSECKDCSIGEYCEQNEREPHETHNSGD